MSLLNKLLGRDEMQPLITPEQLPAYQANQARLQQPSLTRGIRNFINNPQEALIGTPDKTIDQSPIIGIDMTQQDYNNLISQGMPISTGLNRIPGKNGLLQDFTSGFAENANTPFNAENLRPDKNKGLATKTGELLGTVGRFLASPTGRGLLTAGIVGATGGNGLQALGYGANAGVTNQGLRTQDAMYRKALNEEGVDTSKIGGYVTGDMYKNYALGTYRNRKLNQDTYAKFKKMYDDQLTRNEITPQDYKLKIDSLNNKFVEDNITTVEAGNEQKSNQTRNTDVNVALAPARKKYYESVPAIMGMNADTARMNAGTNAGRLSLEGDKFDYAITHPKGGVTQSEIDEYNALNDAVNNFKNPNGKNIFGQPTYMSDEDFKNQTGYTPEQAQKQLSQWRSKGFNKNSVSEGRTATNPKTGEKIILKGGKWQKL